MLTTHRHDIGSSAVGMVRRNAWRPMMKIHPLYHITLCVLLMPGSRVLHILTGNARIKHSCNHNVQCESKKVALLKLFVIFSLVVNLCN